MPTRNPYDFVPFEGQPSAVTPEQLAVANRDRLRGLRGRLCCTLTTLTPLCVFGDPGKGQFARLDQHPIIPATALKGALRSVHEAVTNSRLGIVTLNTLQDNRKREDLQRRFPNDSDKDYRRQELRNHLKDKRKEWLKKLEPFAYLPLSLQHERHTNADPPVDTYLTPSELLFGTTGDGTTSTGWASRLSFSDLVLPGVQRQRWTRPRGPQPNPDHKAFYFTTMAGWEMRGRKFYFHHDPIEAMKIYRDERLGASETVELELWPAQQTLCFTLDFHNLNHDELDSLIYVLELEAGLAHKLGYGKGLGLGSVRIQITDLHLFTAERFLGSATNSTWDAAARDAARERVRAAWQARPSGTASYQAFRQLMTWQTNEVFVYPEFDFFRAERTRPRNQTMLDAYQRAADPPPPPPLPQPPQPPQRRRGRVVYDQQGLRIIGNTPALISIKETPRPIIEQIAAKLEAGQTVMVTYELRQAEIKGLPRTIAHAIELVEEIS